MDEIKQKIFRYLMAILVFTFALVVAASFLYKDDDVQRGNGVQINEERENSLISYRNSRESDDDYEDEKENTEEPSEKTKNKVIYHRDYMTEEDILPEINLKKPLDESSSIEISNNNSDTDEKFVKADNLRKQNKFESAVYEYEKIAGDSYDDITKARCYEEIAITYSSMKRYVSALPFAKISYDLNASERVKDLLIDLYIKTGHKDDANKLTAVKINKSSNNSTDNNSNDNDQKVDNLETIE